MFLNTGNCNEVLGISGGKTLRQAELRTISYQPDKYQGWPTVARRASGELILVCSGGRQRHVCPFGRVELMTSRDEGKTWTWPRVVLDGILDDRDAGMLVKEAESCSVRTIGGHRIPVR